MDRNKIWSCAIDTRNWIDEKKYKADGWSHWRKGLSAVRKHFGEIPKQFVERMAYAFGEPKMVGRSYADVGYIPRKFIVDFISVVRALPDVMFEIAIPTALHLIAKKDELQYFRNVRGVWGTDERKHVWDFWSPKQTIFHPVKLSNPKIHDYMLNWTAGCVAATNFRLPDQYNC